MEEEVEENVPGI